MKSKIINRHKNQRAFLPKDKIHILYPSSIPEYLNTKQASEYLQVSTQWLEIGRVKGYGPKFIKFGRMVRYRRETIDDYLCTREVENTIQGGTNER